MLIPRPWVYRGWGVAMAAWGWVGSLEPAPALAWPHGPRGLISRDPTLSGALYCVDQWSFTYVALRGYMTHYQRGRGHEAANINKCWDHSKLSSLKSSIHCTVTVGTLLLSKGHRKNIFVKNIFLLSTVFKLQKWFLHHTKKCGRISQDI